MDTETETITVRVPSKVKRAVEAAAKASDLTVSQLMRRHIATITPAKPAPRRKPGTQLRKGESV